MRITPMFYIILGVNFIVRFASLKRLPTSISEPVHPLQNAVLLEDKDCRIAAFVKIYKTASRSFFARSSESDRKNVENFSLFSFWMEEKIMIEKEFNQIFPLGEKNDAYAQYFVGQSYLSMLTTERVGIANVTFESGCRNNWHIHHKGGQILLCTAGRGYYQEWGKPAQEMKPGDVINIPPEVKHWHGAAPDSWFSHLAVEVPAEGSSNEWLEQVNEEEYSTLK